MPTGDTANIHPELWAALVGAEREIGEPIRIVSGYRSPQEQVDLWNDRANNPYPVAKPAALGGAGSKHERSPAEAVDLSRSQAAKVRGRFGLYTPHATDPIHVELFGLNGAGRPSSSTPATGAGLGIPNPLDVVGELAKLAGALLNPRPWATRLLEIVGGVALVVLGVRIVAVELA